MCREERPPCEGFFLAVTAEVSEAKVRFFRVCRVLLVASWPGERALGGFHFSLEEGENPKKRVTDTPFLRVPNQPEGLAISG